MAFWKRTNGPDANTVKAVAAATRPITPEPALPDKAEIALNPLPTDLPPEASASDAKVSAVTQLVDTIMREFRLPDNVALDEGMRDSITKLARLRCGLPPEKPPQLFDGAQQVHSDFVRDEDFIARRDMQAAITRYHGHFPTTATALTREIDARIKTQLGIETPANAR